MTPTKQIILKNLKSSKEIVRQQYKAELKGLFGSYARNEQTKNSDIDILVKFLPEATLFDLSGLGNYLEKILNTKVDIVSDRVIKKELKYYINNDLVSI
ncbi:MAG: nucleotidyltransferase family protein [Candidatus Marinimicrobia bacterium]|nr:nucleotidyltransferase family protein [Candidatus Neomarinimicrobiota bacterium]